VGFLVTDVRSGEESGGSLFILRVGGGRVNPPWVSFYNTKTVFRSIDFPEKLLLFAAANELAALFAAIDDVDHPGKSRW
jgi:hypothetical protein